MIVAGKRNYLNSSWLENRGRAAGSLLAKAVLGADTSDGRPAHLSLPDSSLLDGWDWLDTWLTQGNRHFKSFLLEEKGKVDALEKLAQHF